MDVKMKKPHYFELAMNSYSDGELNQEVVLVREYAETPSELTAKQMGFSKVAAVKIVQAVVDAMDQLSMPLQEEGLKEMMEAFEEMKKGKSTKKVK